MTRARFANMIGMPLDGNGAALAADVVRAITDLCGLVRS